MAPIFDLSNIPEENPQYGFDLSQVPEDIPAQTSGDLSFADRLANTLVGAADVPSFGMGDKLLSAGGAAAKSLINGTSYEDEYSKLLNEYRKSLAKVGDVRSTLTAPEQIVGRAGNALDMASGGFADEALAGLGAPATALVQNIPLSEAYNSNLTNMREATQKVASDSPVSANVANVVGGILSPINKIKFLSKAPAFLKAGENASLLKNLATGAIEGAGQGAIYGFGSGQGDSENRLQQAVDYAKLGAGFGAAGSTLGGALEKSGPSLEKFAQKKAGEALGATPKHFVKSRNKSGIEVLDDGSIVTGLHDTIKYIADNFVEGVKDRPTLISKLDFALDIQGQRAADIVKNVDEVLATKNAGAFPNTKKVTPKFTEAQNYVDSLSTTERAEQQKLLDETTKRIRQASDGSLSSLQKEKIALGKKKYNPLDPVSVPKKSLDYFILNDLRRTIEENAAKYLSPEEAKALKQANQEYGHIKTALNIAEPAAIKTQEKSTANLAREVFRTSGAATVSPALLAGISSHWNPFAVVPAAAAGFASHYSGTPAGALRLSQMYKGLSNTLPNVGSGIKLLPPTAPMQIPAARDKNTTLGRYSDLVAKLLRQ